MSLGNYGELKTAIAARLARSNMTALIPDFVLITHAKLMRGHKDPLSGRWIVPPLRLDDMIETSELTPTDGAADLPAGYLSTKLLTSAASEVPLRYMSPADLRTRAIFGQSGRPVFYTIQGGQILIAPSNGETLSLTHFAEVALPSADADTNAIFTKVPQAYLFGALAEAYMHIRQEDRAQLYLSQLGAAVAAANDTAEEGLVSGEPLVQAVGTIA
jgi:hypothetical protein